jgi:ADP-ribosylglycohydrolase
MNDTHHRSSRREFAKALTAGAASLGVASPAPKRDRNRAMGAWFGAAIGDALGGPVEGRHAGWIRKNIGEITGFVPYRGKLGPGGALHGEPGSITDDTYIRVDIARFYVATKPPRAPRMLAEWLLKNADFGNWWRPAVEALERIRDGKVTAENGGLTHRQGGGGAWWTPVGMLFAGDPKAAAAEIRNLSRPWKAPLEQDILAAVHAGTAEAQRERATVDSVVDAVLNACGPLAGKLMGRAVEIARRVKSSDELARELYAHCLVQKCTTEADGPMPEFEKPLEYTELKEGRWYSSVLFAEQQPLALAAFVFGRGEPRRAIAQAVMIGRDCDSTASNVGGWCGGLHGESGLPKEWVETVCEINRRDFDLRGLGAKLLNATA